MTLPAPRPAADGMDDAADREAFLIASASLFDHARPHSRAQLVHGAKMITQKFGGALLLLPECRQDRGRRAFPEAAYFPRGLVDLEMIRRFI